MRYFYDAFLLVVYAVLRFAAVFHTRLRLNFSLRSKLPDFSAARGKTHIWFHASSAGEFEQVRAIALAMRKLRKNLFFSFSYSSDSALRAKKNDLVPDILFALPFDFSWTTRNLVAKMRPDLLIIGKYDAWPNQVSACVMAKVPVYLASATLPESSLRHRYPWKLLLRSTYRGMRQIFAINFEHAQRLKKISPNNVQFLGDTRFDAIDERLNEKTKITELKKYLPQPIFVAGSTYATSEKMLLSFLSENSQYSAIIAPHHVNEARLKEIELCADLFGIKTCRASAPQKSRVIIVDSLGVLPYLYAVGDFAYVGGGFEGSVHSVIEAAAHGTLVITGPQIENSAEAVELASLGLLVILKAADRGDFAVAVENLCVNRRKKSQEIRHYFRERLGVAEKIVHTVMDDLKRIQ